MWAFGVPHTAESSTFGFEDDGKLTKVVYYHRGTTTALLNELMNLFVYSFIPVRCICGWYDGRGVAFVVRP